MAKRRLKFKFLPIPEELMLDEDLSFGAKLLFGIIAKVNYEEVNFKVNTLAERMNCGERETRRRISELEKDGLLLVERRDGKTSNYTINLNLVQDIQTPDESDTPVKAQQGTPVKAQQGSNHIKKENTNKKDMDSDESTLTGEEINSLIGKFEQVNPSYDNLFKMPPQRKAIKQLVDKFGKEELSVLIDALEQTNSKDYAPVITTPHQLLKKVGKLKAFIQRSNNSNKKELMQ